MKETLTELDILRAHHEVTRTAMCEFIGVTDKPGEDVNYLMGIDDLTEHLLKMLGAGCDKEKEKK